MEKILLVNDCKLEEIVLKDLLEEMEYSVIIEDEMNVIEGVKSFLPNIVIVNLVMRENKGNEVIQEIKKLNSDIKCILSSSTQIKLEEYEEYGVDKVIHTPINKEKLVEALKFEKSLSHCPYCGKKL